MTSPTRFNRVDVDKEITAGSIGSANNPITADAKELSGEVYARNFDGDGLASKVESALTWLQNNQGGQGRVRVTPKEDGTNWTWDKEITITLSNYNGVQIDVDANVGINHTGGASEWTLIVDGEGASQRDGETFTLTGGIWVGSNGLNGFCRLQDTNLAKVAPNTVAEYTNGNNDARAVELRNEDSFCEDCIIGPMATDIVDIPVDYSPASVTGGGGTDSYDGCEILSLTARQTQNVGIRFRGKIHDNFIQQPTVFAGDDDMTGYLFDGDMDGTTIHNPKFEPSNPKSGLVAFETGTNYGHSPLVIWPDIVGVSGGTKWDTANGSIYNMGMGSGAGIGEPEGGPSDRFIIADGDTSLFQLDSGGLNYMNQETAFEDGFFMGGGDGNFNGGKVENIFKGSQGDEGLTFKGGAGFYTDGTNLFFVNESGTEEQITSF